MDKVIVTLAEQGNTSAASVPLALDLAVRDGRVQRGHLLPPRSVRRRVHLGIGPHSLLTQAGVASMFAAVFPGQGSQSIGMLSGLAQDCVEVRSTFEEASHALRYDLWALVQEGPEERLNATEQTQPAMLAAGVAAWRCWAARGGLSPGIAAGHSLGEYSALAAFGAIGFEDAVRTVAETRPVHAGSGSRGPGRDCGHHRSRRRRGRRGVRHDQRGLGFRARVRGEFQRSRTGRDRGNGARGGRRHRGRDRKPAPGVRSGSP